MSTNAMTGYGAKFEVETAANSNVFFEMPEVTSLSPPSDSVDVIDVTHTGSPNSTREFIQGLTDPGEASLGCNFIPGTNAATNGDAFVRAWRISREVRTCRITFPNNVVWEFDAFVTGWEPDAPFDDKMTATLTVKVTATVVAS